MFTSLRATLRKSRPATMASSIRRSLRPSLRPTSLIATTCQTVQHRLRPFLRPSLGIRLCTATMATAARRRIVLNMPALPLRSSKRCLHRCLPSFILTTTVAQLGFPSRRLPLVLQDKPFAAAAVGLLRLGRLMTAPRSERRRLPPGNEGLPHSSSSSLYRPKTPTAASSPSDPEVDECPRRPRR